MADKQNTWRKFQEKMKDKRCAKKATKTTKGKGQEGEKEELIVQRLSAEVHGKAQKYSRVGPREFVEFSDMEMTVENIKNACTAYYRKSVGPGMVCDILAGDQGPSCKTIKQIPNLKLIHVRFIPEIDSDVEAIEEIKAEASQSCPEASNQSVNDFGQSVKVPRSFCSPPRMNKKPKLVPKSLSVSTILQLGKLVQTKTTLIKLYSFNFESLIWSAIPVPVEFEICSNVLGEGGFRKAYKAKASTKDFSDKTWVVKRYKPEAVAEIEKINQTVESQLRKVSYFIKSNAPPPLRKCALLYCLLMLDNFTLQRKPGALGIPIKCEKFNIEVCFYFRSYNLFLAVELVLP